MLLRIATTEGVPAVVLAGPARFPRIITSEYLPMWQGFQILCPFPLCMGKAMPYITLEMLLTIPPLNLPLIKASNTNPKILPWSLWATFNHQPQGFIPYAQQPTTLTTYTSAEVLLSHAARRLLLPVKLPRCILNFRILARISRSWVVHSIPSAKYMECKECPLLLPLALNL